MKVHFNSKEETQAIIGSAKSLKNSEKYGKVFIAPDRSPAERAKRRKLVQLLREKKEKEPEMHHYISRGEVCSTEHHSESAPLPSAPELYGTDHLHTVLANEFRSLEERFLSSFDRYDASIKQLT